MFIILTYRQFEQDILKMKNINDKAFELKNSDNYRCDTAEAKKYSSD